MVRTMTFGMRLVGSMEARNILIAIWKKCNGDWDAIYKVLRDKEYIDEDFSLDGVDTSQYVTLLDEEYPQWLKQSYKPPFVLMKGDLQ